MLFILIILAIAAFLFDRKGKSTPPESPPHEPEAHPEVEAPPAEPSTDHSSDTTKADDHSHDDGHGHGWWKDAPDYVKWTLRIAGVLFFLFMVAPRGVRTVKQETVIISNGEEYVVPVSKQAMHIDVSAPCRVFCGTSPTNGTWYRETPTHGPRVKGDITYIKYKAYPHSECTITYSR